jgi:hypothetical protein
VGQCPLFEQVPKLGLIEGVGDNLGQPCPYLGQFAVAHSLDQEFAQGAALKHHLAKDIEDLPAQRVARLIQLFEKGPVDFAITSVKVV